MSSYQQQSVIGCASKKMVLLLLLLLLLNLHEILKLQVDVWCEKFLLFYL